MTPEERQALRQQHYNFGIIANAINGNNDSCAKCWETYPCDVIKVLDATENLKPNDLKTKVECDHVIREKHRRVFQNIAGSWIPAGIDGDETWLEFAYCPKCGEKL